MPTTDTAIINRTTPLKRRNGKLQSCEPCRKRKLSCDHRLPVCSRCIRRKQVDECYYHPAPMTRMTSCALPSPAVTQHSPSESSAVVLSTTSALPTSSSQVLNQSNPRTWKPNRREPHPTVQPRQTSRAETVPPPDRIREILSVPSAGILMNASAPGRSVGFLGDTSSTTFVAELNNNLGIDTPAILRESHPEHLSDEYLSKGVQVLAFYRDIANVAPLIDRWLQSGDDLPLYRPVYQIWYEEIVEVFRNVTHMASLVGLAAQLWHNTQQPLPCTANTTVREWALAATGQNMRWEALGLILTGVGVFASCLPGWDPIFRTGYARTQLLQKTSDLATTCIDLSKICGSRNDLLVCLLYKRMLLISNVQGDTSSEVWTGFSEICDTAVLLGLHLEAPNNADLPFFLRELRVRLFNVIYSSDKFLATFLGRPPRISFRYAVVREPQDLTDAEICSDPQDLQMRLAELATTGGWSTHGDVNRATWRKATTKRHVLREEILEIVISPHTTYIEARLESIRAREQDAMSSMPEFCRLHPEQLIDNIKRDPTYQIPTRGVAWRPLDLNHFLALHTGKRQATFLLERAAVSKRQSDPSKLMIAARELLSLILKAYTIREFLLGFRVEMTKMLAFYAVPAAGVLAVEMLKRDQQDYQYDDFPRSEVLQQLSVLIPALEDVRPDEGDYSICAMGLTAIKKVLDKLLSKPTLRVAPIDAGLVLHGDSQIGGNLVNDADFLQWLGNIDFDTTDWHMPL